MIICFSLKIFPLKVEYVPSVAPVAPPTCQKIFAALAPPESNTLTPAGTLPPEAILKSPAIWKIHTSLADPESVTLVGIVTPVLHLYNPGERVIPPISPAPNSVAVGFILPAASV